MGERPAVIGTIDVDVIVDLVLGGTWTATQGRQRTTRPRRSGSPGGLGCGGAGVRNAGHARLSVMARAKRAEGVFTSVQLVDPAELAGIVHGGNLVIQ